MAALTQAQKNYASWTALAGAILAIVFGILAANSSGGNQSAYIGACVVCALIAVGAGAMLLLRR